MDREQALPLLLFIILAGSLLPETFNLFGEKEDQEEQQPEELVRAYHSDSMFVNVTKIYNLNVVGFSSLSDVKPLIESIEGVSKVSAKPPLINPRPDIPATYLQNLTVVLSKDADPGYIAFKIERLGQAFPKYENFPDNPFVVLVADVVPVGAFVGSIPELGINRTFNGTNVAFEAILLPTTKKGQYTQIEADFLAYNTTIIQGSGIENTRFYFPDITDIEVSEDLGISSFTGAYKVTGLVPHENREYNFSDAVSYDPKTVLRVDGKANDSEIWSMWEVEDVVSDKDSFLVTIYENDSSDNLTAYLDMNSLSYSFEPIPIEIVSDSLSYPDFIYNVTIKKEANITLPESIEYENKTYEFDSDSYLSYLPIDTGIGTREFKLSLLAQYDVIIEVMDVQIA